MSISQKSSQQTNEAILFFAGGAVLREMLYTEFEALLDCVVPMRDLAARDLQAAYVRLDSGLAPVAVVLFRIPFDADGFPEQRWNVPLRQLADSGMRGPDLGGGPVRLATLSQCPLPGQESSLWDIEFGAGGNTLDLIRERLRMNRLGLDASELRPQGAAAPAAPASAPAMPSAPPAQATPSSGTASSEAMLALMQQSNQQIAMIKDQSQREILSMQERLLESHQRIQALEAERLRLQEQIAELRRSSSEDHARAEKKLQMTVDKARAQHLALRKELEGEFEEVLAAREQSAGEELAALERRLADEIGRRDKAHAEESQRQRQELAAQEEQLHNMRSELTELRRDKLRLMGEGADKFFDALRDKGVKLVSFQPGAGHLTIPVEELSRFLEDSDAFVASKCGVGVEHYRRWLVHYTNPVCQGASGSGAPCAKPLQKMLKPSEFVAGLHDRCDIHKQVPRSQALQDRSA